MILCNDRSYTWRDDGMYTYKYKPKVCRLRVFENRVLRRVFGPKRDEVTGKWRKLHNEALNDRYFLPNIVRVITSSGMR
jgi:hypothetical protein